jgi:hypothetical protein
MLNEYFLTREYENCLVRTPPTRSNKPNTHAKKTHATLVATAFLRVRNILQKYKNISAEEAFPWCLRVITRSTTPLSARILQDKRYQAWFRKHAQVINQMEDVGHRVLEEPASSTSKLNLTRMEEMLASTKQNPKVPRYVRAVQVDLDCVSDTLMDNKRFFAADTVCKAREFFGQECVALHFPQSHLMDVVGTMNKVSSEAPFIHVQMDDDTSSVKSNWVAVKGVAYNECYLLLQRSNMVLLRVWLIGDLVTDASAIRKRTTRIAPLLVGCFLYGGDAAKFVALRTLLRFIAVSRVNGRGLLVPGDAGFCLYRYLPSILTLFDVEIETLQSYDEDKVTRDSRGKLTTLRPTSRSFVRGLVAFMQLTLPHFIDGRTLLSLRDELLDGGAVQRKFQLLLEVIDTICPLEYGNKVVDLGQVTATLESGETVEAHHLIYAVMVCPDISVESKRAVFLNTFTEKPLRVPRSSKYGIQNVTRGWKRDDARAGRMSSNSNPHQALGALFTLFEQLSFRGNNTTYPMETEAVDEYDDELLARPQSEYVVRTHEDAGGGGLTADEAWIQRWPDYSVPFIGKNPYLLEMLVYKNPSLF